MTWDRRMDPREREILLEDHGYPLIGFYSGEDPGEDPPRAGRDPLAWLVVLLVLAVVAGFLIGWITADWIVVPR